MASVLGTAMPAGAGQSTREGARVGFIDKLIGGIEQFAAEAAQTATEAVAEATAQYSRRIHVRRRDLIT